MANSHVPCLEVDNGLFKQPPAGDDIIESVQRKIQRDTDAGLDFQGCRSSARGSDFIQRYVYL